MPEETASTTDLFEIIQTTRSMRRLKPDPVPNELTRKISHPDARSVQIGRHIVILVRISKNCRCLVRTARSDGPIWSAGMG